MLERGGIVLAAQPFFSHSLVKVGKRKKKRTREAVFSIWDMARKRTTTSNTENFKYNFRSLNDIERQKDGSASPSSTERR